MGGRLMMVPKKRKKSQARCCRRRERAWRAKPLTLTPPRLAANAASELSNFAVGLIPADPPRILGDVQRVFSNSLLPTVGLSGNFHAAHNMPVLVAPKSGVWTTNAC